jgi:hypothetical protein
MEGISPPQQLDLRCNDLAGEWRRWNRSFNDYLLAIDLVAETRAAERRKLALFRHVGGEDVRELYSQMEFLDGDAAEIGEGSDGRKLNDVLERFQEYCNPRSGKVVSRFEFHNCSQQGEAVDVYLMRLRRLAEGCGFGDQRDSLIRDKLLFGLDDKKTMEKLMRENDDKLSLDYVIRAIRVNEANKALNIEKPSKPTEIGAVSRGPRLRSDDFNASKIQCSKCGGEHASNKCPAYGSRCRKCNAKNHWAAVCKSKVTQAVNELQIKDAVDDDSQVFFGEVFPLIM